MKQVISWLACIGLACGFMSPVLADHCLTCLGEDFCSGGWEWGGTGCSWTSGKCKVLGTCDHPPFPPPPGPDPAPCCNCGGTCAPECCFAVSKQMIWEIEEDIDPWPLAVFPLVTEETTPEGVRQAIASLLALPVNDVRLKRHMFYSQWGTSINFGLRGDVVGGRGIMSQRSRPEIGKINFRACFFDPGRQPTDTVTLEEVEDGSTILVATSIGQQRIVIAFHETLSSSMEMSTPTMQQDFDDAAEALTIQPRFSHSDGDAAALCQ